MAQIKCKYYRYRCYDGSYERSGRICEHHDWCDEYDDGCEFADTKPYRADNGMIAIPLQCKHVCREVVMFEKKVSAFELDDDYLEISRRTIPIERINRLVIDGEIIIDKETKPYEQH